MCGGALVRVWVCGDVVRCWCAVLWNEGRDGVTYVMHGRSLWYGGWGVLKSISCLAVAV